MKRVSAKVKLTVWSTLLMTIMASILMGLMFYLSDDIITSNTTKKLIDVVEDNIDELEFDDGRLELDEIDLFNENIYTLVYTQDGDFLAGNFPEEFVTRQPLTNGELIEVTYDDTAYNIYDRLVNVEGNKSPVWVRGIVAIDDVANATSIILQVALISLPIFVILGAIGCYYIAKRTFRPIDKIVETAEEICKSEDLSLRINLEKGSSELHKLSTTFDNMFQHLENSFETERQFTSDVSHELRTPTAVILAQCEYAIDKNISTEDKNDALETVQRQALKMSSLISDLLNITRIDRGIEKVQFSTINLSQLTNEICEEHKLLKPNGITLTHTISPNIFANFDEAMITRLLSNLISNAFRYSNEPGNVEVALTENNDEIILSVKDDGIGISKENQDKIWKRFYQVDSSRTESQYGSMGLGLAMVEQIAKLHNGKTNVESELGKGSTFTVIFKK